MRVREGAELALHYRGCILEAYDSNGTQLKLVSDARPSEAAERRSDADSVDEFDILEEELNELSVLRFRREIQITATEDDKNDSVATPGRRDSTLQLPATIDHERAP